MDELTAITVDPVPESDRVPTIGDAQADGASNATADKTTSPVCDPVNFFMTFENVCII